MFDLKTAAQTLIVSAALLGFGTGCDLQAALQGLVDQVTQPDQDQDPDPDDDERPDEDPDDDPVEPPIEECELQLDACLEELYQTPFGPDPDEIGVLEELCFVEFEECIGEPEPPVYEECEIELQACLDDVWSGQDPSVEPWLEEERCWIAYDECVGFEPPEPPIYEECEIELEQCLDGVWNGQLPPDEDPWIFEEACWIAYDECIGYPPPPPPTEGCEELFDLCLANGVDPGLCEAVYDDCVTDDEHCDLPEPYSDDGNAPASH